MNFLKLLLFPALTSCGYQPSGCQLEYGWNNIPVKFYLNKDLTQDQVKATKEAIDIWETATGINLFEIEGLTDNSTIDRDGVNVISRGSIPNDSSWVGITRIRFIGPFLNEADIRLNDVTYQFFYSDTIPDYSKVHVKSTMIHEFGHALGLPHQKNTVMQDRILNGEIRIVIDKEIIDKVKCFYGR